MKKPQKPSVGVVSSSETWIPEADFSLACIFSTVDTLHIYKEPDGSLMFRAFTDQGGSVVMRYPNDQEMIRFALAKLRKALANG